MNEQAFLKQYNIHEFEVPLTTVDVVIFTIRCQQLQVLLVKRAAHPYKNQWSLPGGFIDLGQDQSLEQTASRKLREKTGVTTPYLEQLQTFGDNHRDPRGWAVTIAYFALIDSTQVNLQYGAGAADVKWRTIKDNTIAETLAFDHNTILQSAVMRLRNKVEYTALPVHLLPKEFTFSDLQQVFEIVLGRKVDKSAFRRRIKEADIMVEIQGAKRGGSNRPAQLYQIKQENITHFFTRSLIGPR